MKIVANKITLQKLQKDNQQDGFLPIVLKENDFCRDFAF